MKHHSILRLRMSILAWVGMLSAGFLVASCQDEVMAGYYTWSQDSVDNPLNNLNANIRALKAITEANHNNEGIRGIVPFNNGNGYAVDFSDGAYATVLTSIATSGAEGLEDQYAPEVSIGNVDGTYYWMLDGEYLEDKEGAKCNVVGDNSTIPQLSVDDNGYWVLTNGEVSSTLGQRVDGKYGSVFSNVTIEEGVDGKKVTFSFSDAGLQDISVPVRDAGINQVAPTKRREISNTQPTWMIFIDSPSTPDPQKIIDAIPEDIRPFVIFTIAMSINTGGDPGKGDSKAWNSVEYGWETAESWIRVCAQNKVWAMIQPASGGICHFEDYDNYEEMEQSNFKRFYETYPNFLGLNYCEQFWGFSDEYPLEKRIAQWKNFVRLSHQYGGYCLVSFTAGYTAAGINPIYYIRDNAEFAAMLKLYPENFCIVEKFTSSAGVFDTESSCFGMWVSGYAGHYGIRFDECGWGGHNGDTGGLPVAVGAIPVLEHGMLTGQTIQDGPETGQVQCYSEGNESSADDGYTQRNWAFKKQFRVVNEDVFRQFISGLVPIPTREEVIERTKIAMMQNIYSGDSKYRYMSPQTLYTGLYRMPDDGIWFENRNYFKRTGRYPTLPLIQNFADEGLANRFEYKVNCTEYEGMWGNEEKKVSDFNEIFPEEYTGTMFAGRYRNRWLVYCGDPDLNKANIPFQYNTCNRMELEYAKYTSSIIRETSGQLEFFMTNYDAGNLKEFSNTNPKGNTIKIYGCNSQPTVTFNKHSIIDYSTKAGIDTEASYTSSWDAANKVLTLVVSINGSCDFTVQCSGNNTGRKADEIAKQRLTDPGEPEAYGGQLQYEAESFDYKNGVKITKNGCKQEFRYYKGQGYVYFGNETDAAIRYNKVNVEKTLNGTGTYQLRIRYRATEDVSNVHLWYDGQDMGAVSLPATQQDADKTIWGQNENSITLNIDRGDHKLELKADGTTAVPGTLVFDCVYLDFLSSSN